MYPIFVFINYPMEESIEAKLTNLAKRNDLEITFMKNTALREDRKIIPMEYCGVWDEISAQTNSLMLEDLGEHDGVHFTITDEPIYHVRIALDYVMEGYVYLVHTVKCMYDFRERILSDDPDEVLSMV
jgi:hypothetical protein